MVGVLSAKIATDVASGLQAVLTDIATQAKVFVPLLPGTATHSPCGSATPCVNGVTVNSLSLAPVPAVDLNVNSLHPNAAGVSYTTAQLLTAIRAAFPAPPAPANNSAAPAAILPVTGAEPSGWPEASLSASIVGVPQPGAEAAGVASRRVRGPDAACARAGRDRNAAILGTVRE